MTENALRFVVLDTPASSNVPLIRPTDSDISAKSDSAMLIPLSFDDVLKALPDWDYAPYPAMPLAALKRVAALVCAVTRSTDSVVGVIGIVYVPMQGFGIEAYFQVVLVKPTHRLQGVGKQLLSFALEYLRSAVGAQRVRLHTMRDSLVTRVVLGRSVAAAAAAPLSADCAVEMVKAWAAVYERCGFKPRRLLERYYQGGADAVEYVLDLGKGPTKVTTVLKRGRE
jgi:ribosomal protein S18 acetylase RimI-like enzyme